MEKLIEQFNDEDRAYFEEQYRKALEAGEPQIPARYGAFLETRKIQNRRFRETGVKSPPVGTKKHSKEEYEAMIPEVIDYLSPILEQSARDNRFGDFDEGR